MLSSYTVWWYFLRWVILLQNTKKHSHNGLYFPTLQSYFQTSVIRKYVNLSYKNLGGGEQVNVHNGHSDEKIGLKSIL